ncbi:DUF4172 domain-containing protein [Colwellia psychrerythraea]|uniref:DUF4172 domain-containing protein n=1 Tax=Colwellia psychrerythraea TaxID=28229 RepID=UPI000309ECD3|nr:DUF4172 domain-containing protein [Colwellia psychrerythraea]
MWVWEDKKWPKFIDDNSTIVPRLEKCIQGVSPLKQLRNMLTLEQYLGWEAVVLLNKTLSSAKIKGELFYRDSVRSSIVNKLGISKGNKYPQQSDSMV